MKNSFVIMDSWAVALEGLPEHSTSELIKMICRYQMTGDAGQTTDLTANALFTAWKPTIDENNRRYEEMCIKRSEAGKKGNAIRWAHKSQNDSKQSQTDRNALQSDSKASQRHRKHIAKIADSDSDSDSVSKDKEYIVELALDHSSEIKQIIDYLNERTQSHFSPKTAETRKSINARLKEGYTVDDFKKVIDAKVKDWGDNPEMREYLRPQTLFRPSNFESYLNEANRPRARDKKNPFNGFDQNEYDYAALEAQLISN